MTQSARETPSAKFQEMTLSDLDVVLQNETRAYAYPWSRGIFADCLTAGHDCRVMRSSAFEQSLVGHGVLSCGAGEAHLLNVCVRRDVQGRGLGRLMVVHMVQRAQILGAQKLFLEVRPSNQVALNLYASLGFSEIGVRKDYYPGVIGREDAQVLGLTLTEWTLSD